MNTKRLSSKKQVRFFSRLVCFLYLIAGSTAACETSLQVAVKPIPPFVMTDGGSPEGYSIDLWGMICRAAQLNSEYVSLDTVNAVLETVHNSSADAGIAAITINSEREAKVDFSHPFYRSGLRIAVPSKSAATWVGSIQRLMAPDLLVALLGLVALALLAAHLLWFIERGVNSQCFPKTYFSGVGEALWWSVATIITGGCENKAPVSLKGRIVAVVWMLASIVLVASFTATLSAQMTTESVTGAISGPSELPGKVVATVGGTSVTLDLRKLRAVPLECPDLETAAKEVGRGNAEALVFDAPALAYFLMQHPSHSLRLVGPVFMHQDYGIAFPEGSELREVVNQALLTLSENGDLEQLNIKWFGESD